MKTTNSLISLIYSWNETLLFCRELAVCKTVWHIPLLCVQWKTPDDGQRNCPKHIEFYSKNKFEKLVHLFGFIIRMKCDITFIGVEIWIMVCLLVIHFCLVDNGHCLGVTFRLQRPHRILGAVSPNHRSPVIRLHAITSRKTTLNWQCNFRLLHCFFLF